MNIVLGIFIILHGLVHLLYFGHTARFFELKPGMNWPTGSWVFATMLGEGVSRFLVSMFLVLAGSGFVAGGIGLLLDLAWWRTLIITIAMVSALIFIFFWNGTRQNLDGQGVIGLLIDLWLLVMMVLVHWPQVKT